jgi:hypothetical protein
MALSVKQIQLLQQDLILSLESSLIFDIEWYLSTFDKIHSLINSSYYSTQLISISAAVNVLGWVYQLWFNYYVSKFANASVMIVNDIFLSPFLLKEIVFFFYILLQSSYINELHSKFVQILGRKSIILMANPNNNINMDDLVSQSIYSSLFIHTTLYPIKFEILGIIIKRNRIIFGLIGLIVYSCYIFFMVKRLN